MRHLILSIASVALAGCTGLSEPLIQPLDNPENFIRYANYCAIPYDGNRSPQSIAVSGFASVEQQCGNFFDRLAELTQTGRFSHKALEASNLGTQSIMQAAKAAVRSVTIVSASFTLTEAVLNSFIEQYAFSPYLYKIRELTWQAFAKHLINSSAKLSELKNKIGPDEYCDAAILIQQHASICTISSIQGLFDQQVANTTRVVDADERNVRSFAGMRTAASAHMVAPRPARIGGYTPMFAPNYTVR